MHIVILDHRNAGSNKHLPTPLIAFDIDESGVTWPILSFCFVGVAATRAHRTCENKSRHSALVSIEFRPLSLTLALFT